MTLCETFGCLPSDLLKEDPQWVEKLKLVLEARSEYQQEKDRRGARS